MRDKLVFPSELHGNLQEIMQLDDKSLIRRIYCYYLLSDGLILHPAYLWLSRRTHDFVFSRLSQLFSPPKVRTLIGEWASVSDYISDRIDKLEPNKIKQTTTEYLQYKRWGTQLKQESLKLDKIFPNTSSIRLRENRDQKFRNLLVSDLSMIPDYNSLYNQIRRFIDQRELGVEIEKVIDKIKKYIESSSLISCDTIINYISSQIGFRELANAIDFNKRILHLYYYSNIDVEMQASGLEILGDEIMDNFDVDVFWGSLSKICGKEATEALSTRSDETTIRSLITIRNNEIWTQYQNVYFNILVQLDKSLRRNVNVVTKGIKDQIAYHPKILQRIWQKHKISLTGSALEVISHIGGHTISTVLSGFAVAGDLFNVVKKELPPFLYNYFNSDKAKLTHLIDTEVQKILINTENK